MFCCFFMHVVHIQTIKNVKNVSVLPSARSRLQRNATFAVEYGGNMLQQRQLAFLWIFSQMTIPKMHPDQLLKCQMPWVIALGLSLSLTHLSTFSWNNKLSVSQHVNTIVSKSQHVSFKGCDVPKSAQYFHPTGAQCVFRPQNEIQIINSRRQEDEGEWVGIDVAWQIQMVHLKETLQ